MSHPLKQIDKRLVHLDSFNSGGGCMIDLILTSLGPVVGITDEVVVIYPNLFSLENGDINCSYRISYTDINYDKPCASEPYSVDISVVSSIIVFGDIMLITTIYGTYIFVNLNTFDLKTVVAV